MRGNRDTCQPPRRLDGAGVAYVDASSSYQHAALTLALLFHGRRTKRGGLLRLAALERGVAQLRACRCLCFAQLKRQPLRVGPQLVVLRRQRRHLNPQPRQLPCRVLRQRREGAGTPQGAISGSAGVTWAKSQISSRWFVQTQ